MTIVVTPRLVVSAIVALICITIAGMVIGSVLPSKPKPGGESKVAIYRPDPEVVKTSFFTSEQARQRVVDAVISQSNAEFGAAFSEAFDIMFPASVESAVATLQDHGIKSDPAWASDQQMLDEWFSSYFPFASGIKVNPDGVVIGEPVRSQNFTSFSKPGTVTTMHNPSPERIPFLSAIPAPDRVYKEVIVPIVVERDDIGTAESRLGLTMAWNPVDKKWVLIRQCFYDIPRGGRGLYPVPLL